MSSKKNILDVKVPSEFYQRIKTGIKWFDALLTHEGGMVPSLVYMLSGSPGAGKSTLMRQIANGLTGEGYTAFYNLGEESCEQVAVAVEKMGIKHGFDYDSLDGHLALIARLDAILAEDPSRRIVLIQDSIQKLKADASATRAFDALKEWAKSRRQPIIVVFQVTKAGKFAGDNASLHDADVQLEMMVDKKSGRRTLSVLKNRFGPVTDEGVSYVITQSGLELEYPVDVEPEDNDEEEERSDGLTVGAMVRCNRHAHRRHRNKVGKVTKVGRTRITLRTLKGEELYLPMEHVSLAPIKETVAA